jgi:hypothetical protein
LNTKPTTPPTTIPTDTAKGPTVISGWDAIEPGSVVLHSTSKDEGYFLCNVVKVSADRKVLTLTWRDFPGFKPFEVKRIEVGIISKLKW